MTRMGRRPRQKALRASRGAANKISPMQRKRRSSRLRENLEDIRRSYPDEINAWLSDVHDAHPDLNWGVFIHIFSNAEVWKQDLVERRVREMNQKKRRDQRTSSDQSLTHFSNPIINYAKKEMEKVVLKPIREAVTDHDEYFLIILKLYAIVPHLDMIAWMSKFGHVFRNILTERKFWVAKFILDSHHRVHIESYEPFSNMKNPVHEINEFWSEKITQYQKGMGYVQPIDKRTRGNRINRRLEMMSDNSLVPYQNYLVLFNCSMQNLTWWTMTFSSRRDPNSNIRANWKNMYWLLYTDAILAIIINDYLQQLNPTLYGNRSWKDPKSYTRKLSWTRFSNEIPSFTEGTNPFIDIFISIMPQVQVGDDDEQKEEEIFMTEFELYKTVGEAMAEYIVHLKTQGSFSIPSSLSN